MGLTFSPEVLCPKNGDEAAAMLAECNALKRYVVPWGGGTHQDIGSPPTHCDVVLSTANMTGMLEYAPEDLTVSVRAGTSLASVNAMLREHGQFLPIDAENPEDATVGGSVAIGAGSLRRARYGAARDMVIGLTVALTNGTLTRSGGRVVKNVAGYDLCKVFTGSLGTLGVIISANFRVFPIPRSAALIRRTYADAERAFDAARRLVGINSYFVFVLCEGQQADESVRVTALVEGQAGSLQTEVDFAVATLGDGEGEYELLRNADALSALQMYRAQAAFHGAAVRLRCSTPPALVSKALQRVRAALATSSLDAAWRAEFLTGKATLCLEASHNPELLASVIHSARKCVRDLGGHLTVEGGTPAFRRIVDVWGAPHSAEALSRGVKLKLDPSHVLNAGRFAHGI